jgi:hypothetical protein
MKLPCISRVYQLIYGKWVAWVGQIVDLIGDDRDICRQMDIKSLRSIPDFACPFPTFNPETKTNHVQITTAVYRTFYVTVR